MRKLILLALLAIAVPASAQIGPAPYTVGNITAAGSTCGTTNACVTLNLPANTSAVSVQTTGTWSQTLKPEYSVDSGTTWNSAGSDITSNAVNTYSILAYTNFRVRASAVVSGTAAIRINASVGVNPPVNVVASADNQTPLTVSAHSSSQSAPLVDINDNDDGTAKGTLSLRGVGEGDCDGAGTGCLEYLHDSTNATDWLQVFTSNNMAAGEFVATYVDAGGLYSIEGDGTANSERISIDPSNGRIVLSGTDASAVTLQSSTMVDRLATSANCADSAGAAACAKAAAGHFVIDASSTSTVVSTTAVTANSEVILTRDDSLGTLLSVTCNTQSSLTLGTPRVTARTAGTSFTVSIDVGPTTNPMCVGYMVIN